MELQRHSAALDAAIHVALAAIAIYIFGSTVLGIVNAYSPIPVMDQWETYNFYHAITHGDYAAWWRPHNEHRIVISKILFFLDIRYFNGANKFLLIADFFLLSSIVVAFSFHTRLNSQRRPSVALAISLPSALLYAWVQSNNLTWGYQSQFIAVYLFATCAFFFVPIAQARGWKNNSPIWIFATLSMLSMSNGILTFPILALQLFLTKAPSRKLLLSFALWLASWAIYFVNYTKPGGQAIHLESITHLWALVQFYLAFLGSPAYFFLPGYLGPLLLGLASSVFMVMAAASLHHKGRLTPYRTSLFVLWLFIALSALAAATGRYQYGLEMAVSSRYTTPALVGWTALSFFVIDILNTRALRRFLFATLFLVGGLASYQHHSGDPVPDNHYREMGVLSIKMGVNDRLYFAWLLPVEMSEILLNIAHTAEKDRIAIYGSGWLSQVGQLKFEKSLEKPGICVGAIETGKVIPNAIRLSGWAAPLDSHVDGKLIIFVDSNNSTVGYGVTGERRVGGGDVMRGTAGLTGWRGYVVHASGPVRAYLYTKKSFCPISGKFDVPQSAN